MLEFKAKGYCIIMQTLAVTNNSPCFVFTLSLKSIKIYLFVLEVNFLYTATMINFFFKSSLKFSSNLAYFLSNVLARQ